MIFRPLIPFMLALTAMGSTGPEGMTLVWSDEFDYTGAPDPEKWTHELGAGGWGNGEVQTYTDELENSRVENGHLVIEVQQKQIEGSRSPNYTSARLITRDKGEWKYGRMEVRAKLPSETGTWPAIWMLAAEEIYGDAYWPDNGEIDIMEHVGYEEDPLYQAIAGVNPNIHGTLHMQGTVPAPPENPNYHMIRGGKTMVGDASSAFHTYAINWTAERIEFEVDGAVYYAVNLEDLISKRNPPPPEELWKVWPFDQPFFMILNVAVGGNWGGHFNSYKYPQSPYGTNGVDDIDGVWPQRMEVDYVRVYSQGWKGLATDEFGNADTQSWLGWINVNAAPWLYSYTLSKYVFMTAATEEIFHTDSQWVYIPTS
jgi:beta-glucanase (GH16 family)